MIPRLLRTGAMVLSPWNFAGNMKNLALWRRLRHGSEALSTWNEYFDSEEYQRLYPDVRSGNVNATVHFLLRANSEFRDPSLRFDTRYYLGRNPVVAQSGLNPLLHFALFGKKRGQGDHCPQANSSEVPADRNHAKRGAGGDNKQRVAARPSAG